MASILIKNGSVVTMDEYNRILADGAVYIEGARAKQSNLESANEIRKESLSSSAQNQGKTID